VATALQAGIEATKCVWVARMDSDDIALPTRLAVQVQGLQDEGCDVLGTAVAEFVDDPGMVSGVRRLPEQHGAIARAMRTRNPINHPSVMFRRQLALDAGGYRDLPGLEDYDLWARMLVAGARFHNLPDVHLHFRAGPSMLGRRRARAVAVAEIKLQRNLRTYGLIGPGRALLNLMLRSGFRLLPRPLMSRAYSLLFHARGESRQDQGR
jgi:hypothetical protein